MRRPRIVPASWLHLPGRSARLRLTALYGGLFLVSGAALLAITYVLFNREAASYIDGIGFPRTRVVLADGRTPTAQQLHQLQAELAARNAAGQAATRAVFAHQLLISSGIALAVVAVIAIFLGWLVAGRVLKPVRDITSTARRISSTNLHERLALDPQTTSSSSSATPSMTSLHASKTPSNRSETSSPTPPTSFGPLSPVEHALGPVRTRRSVHHPPVEVHRGGASRFQPATRVPDRRPAYPRQWPKRSGATGANRLGRDLPSRHGALDQRRQAPRTACRIRPSPRLSRGRPPTPGIARHQSRRQCHGTQRQRWERSHLLRHHGRQCRPQGFQ